MDYNAMTENEMDIMVYDEQWAEIVSSAIAEGLDTGNARQLAHAKLGDRPKDLDVEHGAGERNQQAATAQQVVANGYEPGDEPF